MGEILHRRIIIGDVHGHFEGLMTLLDAIAPGAEDQVCFLGDLIDRGPQSAQVVNFVQQNSYSCILGNHEQLMLEAFPNGYADTSALQAWLYSGGNKTVASYGDNLKGLLHDVEWFKTLPTYLDLGDLWLVHAGVHPCKSLEEQTHQDLCWIRDEFHASTQPFFSDKLIITGHTITFTFRDVSPGEIVQGQGWLDIDTGAYHHKSGWLTALDMTNRRVYQVNVFKRSVRVMPLDEVTVQLDPKKVGSIRHPLSL
jgi:serine/threonine protein phosphatase 1